MNRKPTDDDVAIGRAIKRWRLFRGFTQMQLGDALGVEFQQIQKYENGVNRVPAARLWRISRIMGIRIDSFFGECHG